MDISLRLESAFIFAFGDFFVYDTKKPPKANPTQVKIPIVQNSTAIRTCTAIKQLK